MIIYYVGEHMPKGPYEVTEKKAGLLLQLPEWSEQEHGAGELSGGTVEPSVKQPEDMTRKELDEYAEAMHGIKLDRRRNKEDMLAELREKLEAR